MGEEDGLRTVECLRGRLLAERSASRNAKEEAEQIENKLVELEAQLKEEIKSRKKAEKRLKLLTKRLQSLNISDPSVLSESDQSCTFGKSDVTSVSSYASCTSKKTEDKKEITTEHLIESTKMSSELSENFNQDSLSSRTSISSKGDHQSAGDEETISSVGEAKGDDTSLISSNEEHKDNGEDNARFDDVDYSMALVPVDLPKTAEPSRDVVVLDTTVKEVLDSLRRVKEKIQISMEQRRMVRV